MKKLILAEKPSVAKNIADATDAVRKNGYFEGEEYIITWAFGHLLQLFDAKDYDPGMKTWKMEKFPYIPEAYRYKLKADGKNKDKPDAGVEKQMNLIKKLADRKDVSGLICATDDDREGQIIAEEIFDYLRSEKPIERVLLNEWTEKEVKRGLSALKPNEEMRPLKDAGFGRQIADWLIGINLTSVATLKCRNGRNSKLINVGRVLMPTLKIIYDRDKEIREFQVTKYYRLKGTFETGQKKRFEGTYVEDKKEKFNSPKELYAIRDRIEEHKALVTEKKVARKKEYAPYLFNLSNLQGYITGKYKGWTSDRVLKTAQDLYEKKLITYPRTASVVLEESLIGQTKGVLERHKKGSPYEDQIAFHTSKRVFDSKRVESHSAIIPTYVLPKNLKENERVVYEAVRNRFLAQFMPAAVTEDTELHLSVKDVELPGHFLARGKILLEPGWKRIEGIETKEAYLPNVNRGDEAELVKAEVCEAERKPPKPHTEKTLLKVMETCGRVRKNAGKDEENETQQERDPSVQEKEDQEMMMAILSGFSIGTPATRAETIKKLKDTGYIQARGKSLTCTELGKNLVETFPARELFDLNYTGRLEKTLLDIEKGKHSKEEFLSFITDFVKTSVEQIKADSKFGALQTAEPLHTEPAGICPECGADVVETAKAFGCSRWKEGCKFVIWKNDRLITSLGKKVTYEMVKILLENGKVGFRGCVSKKGNRFSAYFYYEKDEKTGRYRWRMEFIN